MRSLSLILFAALSLSGQPRVLKHTIVYKEAGRFGGWPANHGIWSWGNEILAGFSAAYFQLKTPDRHQYDNTKPEEPRLARTLDGGETWTVEAPASLLPPEQGGRAVADLDAPMDFTNPNFAMTLRFTGTNEGASRLWYSYDRGKTWRGSFSFPMFGRKGVAARTDYIVNGPRDAFVFLTASKSNGREGRVFCARTTDGGMNWKFVSWIGEESPGFSIMPSSVRVSSSEIVTATRVKRDQDTSWIDLYRSTDNGASWELLTRPTDTTGAFSGNPPSLIKLPDGRLCLTYGTRSPPYGIRARLSSDNGKTWSPEIVLRNDGAAWDIGYVRSAARPDGKVVTVYYFAEQPQRERIIAATLWDPGTR
jgi:hypothetical protein